MARFESTHWSVVLAAASLSSGGASQALERLCAAYWYPLYSYIRSRGVGPEDAHDLTQEFFVRFLDKGFLKDVRPEKGKFRTFLLASLNHFLSNEWDRARAQKRGGHLQFLPLDFAQAEERHARGPGHTLTPEALFERAWAMAVLDAALAKLRDEYAGSGKEKQFELLKGVLVRGEGGVSYRDLGSDLGLSEGAIKVAVHRLRRRYRDLMLEEISQTLAEGENLEEEMRHLMAALSA